MAAQPSALPWRNSGSSQVARRQSSPWHAGVLQSASLLESGICEAALGGQAGMGDTYLLAAVRRVGYIGEGMLRCRRLRSVRHCYRPRRWQGF